jgi:hypothetical protein
MTTKQQKIEEWKEQIQKVSGSNQKLVFDEEIINEAKGWELPDSRERFQFVHSSSLKDLRGQLRDLKRKGKSYILHYVEEHEQPFTVCPFSFTTTPIDPPLKTFIFIGKILT